MHTFPYIPHPPVVVTTKRDDDVVSDFTTILTGFVAALFIIGPKKVLLYIFALAYGYARTLWRKSKETLDYDQTRARKQLQASEHYEITVSRVTNTLFPRWIDILAALYYDNTEMSLPPQPLLAQSFLQQIPLAPLKDVLRYRQSEIRTTSFFQKALITIETLYSEYGEENPAYRVKLCVSIKKLLDDIKEHADCTGYDDVLTMIKKYAPTVYSQCGDT